MRAQDGTTFAASLALALLLPEIGAAQDRDDEVEESAPVHDATPVEDAVEDSRAAAEDSPERDVDARDVDGAEGSEPSSGGRAPITVRDYSEENPPPPANPELGGIVENETVEVAEDAGVGSPLAYARATVLELGGTVGFRHQSETTQLALSPSLGYFLVDGFQLTLFLRFDLNHISGGDDPTSQSQTDVAFAVVVEPSYHVAITDSFYLFAGAGVGAMFSRDPTADFLFRPRAGADLLVGRSAIFKPAVFVDVGAIAGFAGVGVEGSFSAMW